MPNLNGYIITSALYKIILVVPTAVGSQSFPLQTVASLDWGDASEGENIWAVSVEDPIGNKSNANSYKGKISMQVGELNLLLSACGFDSAIRIRGATLALTALQGGFAKVYKGVNINTDSASTKAKDKESLTSLDWIAIGLG